MNNKKEVITPPKKENAAIIKASSIVSEMENSYLDYAMSVIVARALPDVRDGLKPVHRRILFAMHKMGLVHKAKFRKSASVAGEVIGKYHPHGDVAVYDALVRLAQDFSSRYPLIEGQGNFGSIDGDPPAHMRYTECRMEKITAEMLKDINRDTVDFRPTYDETRKEPRVLPAAVPQLLLNGQVGIAVGMATNIPPHNLGEVVDACIHLIDNPESETVDLLEFVQGPDFPTGGSLYNKQDIIKAYVDGRGGMVTRGKAMIEESDKKGFQIVITEITYQTVKANFIQHIAKLAKDKKIEGIRNIVDESNKNGIRIIVDLKKDVSPKKVLNKLYKMTDLQKTFHLNMLALVDGIQPKVLNLKEVLDHYLKYRYKVIKRGFEYDLRVAKDREHILEGLKKALDHIDEIIQLIKKSRTKESAHTKLKKEFKFSDKQATAILEMRLQQLAGLERKKIEDELKAIKKLIAWLEDILGSEAKLWNEVKKSLLEVKEKYEDERRTKIVKGAVGEFSDEDFVQEENVIIVTTKSGYVKRMNKRFYRAQGRGGKGITGMRTKEEDVVDNIITVNSLADILFFTSFGRAFKVKAYEIPETRRGTKGQALVNFLDLQPNEEVTSVLPMPETNGSSCLTMVTRKGQVKRLKVKDLDHIRRSGLIVMGLKSDDSLVRAVITSGSDHILIVSKRGQAIRFKEANARIMGRSASGVRAIKLKKEDAVVGVGVVPSVDLKRDKELELFTIMENGYGKRTRVSEYKIQGRGGSGIKAASVTAKTGEIAGLKIVDTNPKAPEEGDVENINVAKADAIVISKRGQVIRLKIKQIKTLGRATQGVTLMRMKSGDQVAAVTFI